MTTTTSEINNICEEEEQADIVIVHDVFRVLRTEPIAATRPTRRSDARFATDREAVERPRAGTGRRTSGVRSG